jgi:RNA-directed DNA polymerase
VYYIKKFGLDEHLSKTDIVDKQQYLNSLKGRIAFVLQTIPNDKEFLEYKNYLKTAKNWNS